MISKKIKRVVALFVITAMLLSAISFTVMADTITVQFEGEYSTVQSQKNCTFTSNLIGEIGGKSADDKYYLLSSKTTASDDGFIRPYSTGSKFTPYTTEMSFLLPEGSDGLRIETRYYVNIGSSTPESQSDSVVMTITPEGLNPSGNHSEVIDGTAFEYNKWYNLAIVHPYSTKNSDGTYTYNKTMIIYINGDEVARFNDYQAVTGKYPIHSLYRLNEVGTISEGDIVYLDNLRRYEGTYTPAIDAVPELEIANNNLIGKITSDNILLKAAESTVADVKNAISRKNDTNLRFYNAAGTLLTDSGLVTEGTRVVAAASNGTGMERTYSYYTISVEAASLNIYADLDFSTGEPCVVMDVQSKNITCDVYMAVYDYNNLEKVFVYKDCVNGIKTQELDLDVSKSDLLDFYSIRIFAWDKFLEPIIKPVDVRMSEKLVLIDYSNRATCDTLSQSYNVEYNDDYLIYNKGSLKYDYDLKPDPTGLSINISPHDWEGYNTLNIEVYSAHKTNESIRFIAYSQNAETEGDDYYSFFLSNDWEGKWKTSSFSFDYENPQNSYGFSTTRSPLGFNQIDRISLSHSYSSSTISPDTEIYISRVYLTKENKFYKDTIDNFPTYNFSSLVKSVSNGAHPRLIADEETLTENIDLINDNSVPLLNNAAETVIALADKALEVGDSDYELYDGSKLVRNEREMIRSLATAYVITGRTNKDYLNRCYRAMEVMASWPNWNPEHYLDIAEAAYSFAIAYDLLYDDLEPEQRQLIEQALMEKAIKPSLKNWEIDKGVAAETDNWQCVCSGGIGMAALVICDSVSDEDAQICNKFISHAIRTLPRGIREFAPDGVYPEGLAYWGYATEYLYGFIMTLKNAVNDDFGLSSYQGLSKTGYYPISSLGPAGAFNFYDATYSATSSSRYAQMFTIANIHNQPDIASFAATKFIPTDINKINSNEPNSNFEYDTDVSWLDIVSYRHSLVQRGGDYTLTTPKDHLFKGEQHLVYTRSGWGNEDIYVAYKGGNNATSSHADLDIGQFVLDSQGVRWFHDLGAESYSASGYFDTDLPTDSKVTRWSFYRKRAEGHNTLVINPDTGADQKVDAFGYINTFKSADNASYGIIDMTEAYADDATSVNRGIALINGRQDVLIQDEIKANGTIDDVYSFFHVYTKINDVTITIDESNPSVAYLEQAGKKIRLDIISGNATWGQMGATPLKLSVPAGALSNRYYKKLFIHLEDTTNPTISVLIRNIYTDVDDVAPTVSVIPLEQWDTYLN